MPAGLPRELYDTLCARPGDRSYSRALRQFKVAVTPELRPYRGIQVASPDATNPAGPLANCVDKYLPQELGTPTSVLSVYYFSLENLGGNTTDVPSPIIFQIRQGTACVTTVRFTGTLGAKSFSDKDLLIQVAGLLGTQWEIWARIDAGGPVNVSLAVCLDEFDGKRDVQILGPNFVASGP